MKICPQCQTTYTDDTLQFCLQDGNPLNNYSPGGNPTVNWSESETLVKPRQPAVYDTQKSASQHNWQANEEVIFTPEPPEPEKSGILKTVLLTLLGVIVVSAIGGTVGYILWKNSRNKEIAANQNAKPVNTKTPAVNKTANANENVNTNTNANENTNTNTATPTPKPTLAPEEIEQAKENVENVIDDWKTAYESLDLEYSLSHYAETIDYYKNGKVGIGRVRADKEKAFDAYDKMKFDISNVTVTPDPTGDKATAVFDKEWTFENSERTNSGKVQQQMTFIKKDGKWKISGEKDLSVYYVNR